MRSVLVTGANGFVGKALCQLLINNEMLVKAAIRKNLGACDGRINYISVGEINGDTQWQEALAGIDCVVHLAARVHVMKETALNPLDEFRRVNTEGTEKLARDAVRAGVKNFIYLSTIKVNGEATAGQPFTEQVDHPPVDPYAFSKWEAENILKKISVDSGMNVVIIRPPLVYGPGVKGNFLSLVALVTKRLPLPFGAIKNKRSLVALSNLIDLIRECIVNPTAAGETFLVSDNEDLSTTELIEAIARGFGQSPRLLPVPARLLQTAASLLGKKEMAGRLLDSLQVNSSKATRVLGWYPPKTVDYEMVQVARWYGQRQ